MAIKSICKLCGNTVEGEIKFCPICGGETTVTEDMSSPASDASAIPNYSSTDSQSTIPTYNQPMQYNQQTGGKKGCAIAGMIVGISSLVFSCYGIFALIAGAVGLILSIMGLKSDKRGMAVAGVICSAIALVFALITTVACGGVMCSAFTDGFEQGFNSTYYGY